MSATRKALTDIRAYMTIVRDHLDPRAELVDWPGAISDLDAALAANDLRDREIHELRATLENERGEGSGPGAGWEWDGIGWQRDGARAHRNTLPGPRWLAHLRAGRGQPGIGADTARAAMTAANIALGAPDAR